MPYKNKEDYNNYLRNYMKERRSVKPVKPCVKPKLDELRGMIRRIENRPTPLFVGIPPAIDEALRVDSELDAEGQPIPEYI